MEKFMYYCLYFYDGTNSITGRFPFTCVDDTLAQSIAKLHAQGTNYELWNRNRLVTRRQEISEDVDFATGLRRRGYII
jgi:hypothetical protein